MTDGGSPGTIENEKEFVAGIQAERNSMYMPMSKEMVIHCLQMEPGSCGTDTQLSAEERKEWQELLQASGESYRRVRLCALILPEKQQQAIRETYGKREKVQNAANRMHCSRNTVSKYRKQGVEVILRLYHSEYTEQELRTLGIQTLLGKKQPG